jgi:hypothetical protein
LEDAGGEGGGAEDMVVLITTEVSAWAAHQCTLVVPFSSESQIYRLTS